jgi:signal transduction histidine kinase
MRTDPTFIRRTLTNLVNNAIQAMPKGGKLTITASQKENQTTITVEDTGKGIPEEIKPKLFTPLFTTKSKGQGFGLAVTKRLIEALGGTISFESEAGKGTIFFIKFSPKTKR